MDAATSSLHSATQCFAVGSPSVPQGRSPRTSSIGQAAGTHRRSLPRSTPPSPPGVTSASESSFAPDLRGAPGDTSASPRRSRSTATVPTRAPW
jgi:hypothetical protein